VDAKTQQLVLSNESITVLFDTGIEWSDEFDVFHWCTMKHDEFAKNVLQGEEGLVSIKCTHLANNRGTVIGVMASHMYFDGNAFYALIKNLSALYEGCAPNPVAVLTSTDWPHFISDKIGSTIEDAIALGRAKSYTPLMEVLQETNWGKLWHTGVGRQESFSLDELKSMKTSMTKLGCKRMSNYKIVCAHLANVYATLFNWTRVRTFHLMNVRDRISSFPAAKTGYVSCGIAFFEIKLENAQDPKQICEDLTKGFEDDGEIESQIVEYLKLVAATGMAWFPFTPLCYDDRGFPDFGPDDVPILVFNSHAFQQDTISFNGPMVDYVGWTVCNHIHTPSPSWRPGFDINCIIPPEVWVVTQDKWKAMVHKYYPTNACAIQTTLTHAKACTDRDSFNAFNLKRARTGLGVCGQ